MKTNKLGTFDENLERNSRKFVGVLHFFVPFYMWLVIAFSKS